MDSGPAPGGASRNDEGETGAKMRPFCCQFLHKLMQFFLKNDRRPQTDSERAAA
jgi:hypothetical protein